VFDIKKERVTELLHDLAPLLESRGIATTNAESAEKAIRAAQVTVPVTTTTTGYIRFDWLQPGSLLVNISLDDPEPEVVLRAHKVVVDDWNLIKNDTRRLLGRMYRKGQVTGPNSSIETNPNGCRRIDAELGEIVTGEKAGRNNLSEIILVNPFGLSIEDLALASEVYQAAKNSGMGTFLER
jgi:ornithine cyclodeaminase